MEHRLRYGSIPALYGMSCGARVSQPEPLAPAVESPSLVPAVSTLGAVDLTQPRAAFSPYLRSIRHIPERRAPARFADSGHLSVPAPNAPPILA